LPDKRLRLSSDRAPNYQRAHDLIAKPPTLWRIMRSPLSRLVGMIMTDQI
jgi:hypothetical protein